MNMNLTFMMKLDIRILFPIFSRINIKKVIHQGNNVHTLRVDDA